ncbi:transcriptional regulator FeaR [Archangium violaceum]|uniref:transcriptional regulator FeaR n=1 Tax=Archangium violaceum TaxID=83451 RepID=UPI001950EE7E|nr:transcriptional regulator FeaR [Archangium violaceum]QRO00966.1 transcriptional regulator FeaR [Archangium violaceum]
MGRLLTTTQVPPREQFDFWHEVVCQRFVPLDTRRQESGPFLGRLEATAMSGLVVTDIVADPQQVVRSRQSIASSDPELLMVCLHLDGEGAVEQDERLARLSPGDLVLFDSTRPYRLLFDSRFRQLVFHFPRQRLLPRLADPCAVTAVRVDGRGGVGRLAADFLRSLGEQAGALDARSAPAIFEQVMGLLSLAFGAPLAPEEEPASPAHLARLKRIQAYIEEHLSEPELSPADLAAAHHVSVRYLHRLFELAGCSVGDWLRERRLVRCAESLADPRQRGRGVSEVAFAWGFNDASHFSRAFKQRFGVSPREYRERALLSVR